MSGKDLKLTRQTLGNVLGERLSYADMAKVCGLSDPAGNGKDTYRKWEDGDGPSGPVSTMLGLIMDGLLDADPVRDFMLRHLRDRLGWEIPL